MKKGVCLFSYDRYDMLCEAVNPLNGWADEVAIFDDGSPYLIEGDNVFQYPHGGKENFWQMFDRAFKWCEQTDCDLFVFMPDDFLKLDTKRIDKLSRFLSEPYAFNLINDGRLNCWNPFPPKYSRIGSEECVEVGFCDGGFFCTRKTLELLTFTFEQVAKSWFNSPTKSSGIGYQLTKRMADTGVRMYKPLLSLAYHGDHNSKMHPEERKRNPLISK